MYGVNSAENLIIINLNVKLFKKVMSQVFKKFGFLNLFGYYLPIGCIHLIHFISLPAVS
jgi:hypothetical protein